MVSREENLRDALLNAFPGKVEVHVQRPRRVWAKVHRDELRQVVAFLSKNLHIEHLAVIAAVDLGIDLAAKYVFFQGGTVLTVTVVLPRNAPKVASIVDIFPGAVLYERELKDVMGIVPEGHPDLRRLILPENWEGGFPLRKDWKPRKPKGGGGSA
jgi:Ni,Fe-hydrogenase III component G